MKSVIFIIILLVMKRVLGFYNYRVTVMYCRVVYDDELGLLTDLGVTYGTGLVTGTTTILAEGKIKTHGNNIRHIQTNPLH